MAGIGFKLARMAQVGGIGGVVAAASHGAIISSGPWLMAAGAVIALEAWGQHHAGLAATGALQTILVYAFSLSALAAAPTIAVATRVMSDLLYAKRHEQVPGILVAALASAAAISVPIGALVFTFSGLVPVDQLAATAILTLLSQIWVANLFLTATRRHWAVLTGYAGGIGVVVVIGALAPDVSMRGLLWLTLAGVAVTTTVLVRAVRHGFLAPPIWPTDWAAAHRRHAHLAIGGTLATLAIWIDKWIIWYAADDSVAGLSMLRFHPVYDPASFLGLLSLVPGLTLLLVATETRFDRSFAVLMAACTGTAPIAGIRRARRALINTVLHDVRLLTVAQATIAAALWVLAPELFKLIGADPRGIFAFRFTVVGAVFHLVTLFFTIILSYFDLAGRVLMVWTMFFVVSAATTLATVHAGFAWYGWGYLAGAVIAAMTGVMLAGHALWDLIYLLFVGNNPAVVGERRRWA
ncbi:hypothetical protein ASG67_17355 [Sphingomonas sp. Leaf339]|uniref:exopolysaccharide Pel transporter PelG n=1 Tax=Sphingomonas sp. Leaf339 TaxID=1736343 RepID=UPI000700EAFA|nr:exopolysaccharide Pel transporter PelG [Sphingomonas sp. Leaf339]KQU57215.1 hypothetical protein ASG67_17355 [Sphingomonas sp. Leaf339]